MSRIIKSKFYKPLISLLVAVILVFSFEVNKPKAIVPILLWGGSLIAGIVAEEVVEMGIRHYSADGKATTKSKTKKIADEIFEEYGAYGFDFLNTNPKRKADGSLEVYPSANDRAKIARKIADEFADILEEQGFREGNANLSYGGMVIKPIDTHPTSIEAMDFIKTMLDTEVQYSTDDRDLVRFNSVITGLNIITLDSWDSRTGERYEVHSFPSPNRNLQCFKARMFDDRSVNDYGTAYAYCDNETLDAWDTYKMVRSLGKSIAYGGGVAVPSTLGDVYPAPKNMRSDYQLPNYQELSNKPTVIKNVYPVSQSDDDSYTWETVNNDYETDNSVSTRMEQNVDTYLENGDMVTNNYDIETVNNYYTDSNYPVKSGDIDVTVIVDVDVPPPVVIDDDDDSSAGDLPPQAEVLDRTLISYAKQTYDYLGDSIDGAITSMRDITDDASGLVDYLDTSFRWLPAEWRALFGSAFILGVFAHFMRR